MSSSDSHEVSAEQNEQPRKLAILGLPWDTSEETLRMYFAQFGHLENAEIMKDRYTGKSRGFGFVTFMDAGAAQNALATEHSIDGRRCEAKIALPKGEPTPPRTTRIFVARIPPSVTESQFRAYFENFGKLQDAYMPKDHSKQGYRGIGFVTFASPESVEKVMAVKHWMNGHEIAIDRATPKEEPASLRTMFSRLPLAANQRRSFDNGAGIIGPGLTSVMNLGGGLGQDVPPQTLAMAGFEVGKQPGGSTFSQQALRASQALNLSLGLGLQHHAGGNNNNTLQNLAKAQGSMQDGGVGLNPMTQGLNAAALQSLDPGLLSPAFAKGVNGNGLMMRDVGGNVNTAALNSAAAMQQLLAAAANKRMADSSVSSSVANSKRLENPAIASARAGPRIFIGKLTKDTSESDVKEYFMKFGYVMDVYLPKAKDNKTEHRGFGFVTFETEAAIQRVVSHGTHRLKGSTIAIDIAMPKVEENELAMENGLDGSCFQVGITGLMSQVPQRM